MLSGQLAKKPLRIFAQIVERRARRQFDVRHSGRRNGRGVDLPQSHSGKGRPSWLFGLGVSLGRGDHDLRPFTHGPIDCIQSGRDLQDAGSVCQIIVLFDKLIGNGHLEGCEDAKSEEQWSRLHHGGGDACSVSSGLNVSGDQYKGVDVQTSCRDACLLQAEKTLE